MTRKMKEVRGIVVIIVAAMMFRCVTGSSNSNNHTVGGRNGWSLSNNLQAWSTSTTFHAGDFLVFMYTPVHDVVEVSRLDFVMCRTINPISTHNDGNTVVQLSEAGTRYFICGRRGHCALGLKVRIQVLPQLATNSTTAPPPAAAAGGAGRGGGRGKIKRPPPHSPPPPKVDSHPPPKKEKPDVPDLPSLPPQSRVSPGPMHCSGVREVMVRLEDLWVIFISLLIFKLFVNFTSPLVRYCTLVV